MRCWWEISLLRDSSYCLIGSNSLPFTIQSCVLLAYGKSAVLKWLSIKHNCSYANSVELCTWVTILIALHLQKCFVINVMKMSGYIYLGSLYLSLISCQWCSSDVSNIMAVTVERQCYGRIFNSVLSAVNDVIHSQGPRSHFRMRRDK